MLPRVVPWVHEALLVKTMADFKVVCRSFELYP